MKLSIVTVNFNDVVGLKRTCQSVKSNVLSLSESQCKDFEWIIIDGGSTDGSANVISDYESLLKFSCSESDNGIYDAMNKGIDFSDGDFVLFLNSGDEFYSKNSLSEVLRLCEVEGKVVFWKANIVNEGDTISRRFPSDGVNNDNVLTWLNKNKPHHQAMLFPKIFYKKNYYDSNIRISSDADYKIRAMNYCGTSFYNLILTTFYLGGVSSGKLNWRTYKVRMTDSYLIASKNYAGIKGVIFLMKRSLVHTLKYIRSLVSLR
ncbi:MAG: glycosyltransferase [Vibrio litoralis]|uniref:glycosyltransferase n=1 Tax=Vibrio litoralis TaxID=335972 RepID=UPI003F9B09D7